MKRSLTVICDRHVRLAQITEMFISVVERVFFLCHSRRKADLDLELKLHSENNKSETYVTFEIDGMNFRERCGEIGKVP